jgi:peroxiredoxin (alkyl hydroperoxide reductase subunit C)
MRNSTSAGSEGAAARPGRPKLPPGFQPVQFYPVQFNPQFPFSFTTTNHKEVEPMSIVGTSLKPFQATAYVQGKFVDVSDADVLGKWAVFFFYPADFTFVCPTELEDLADSYEELKGLGVEVYSVSTDTHFCHKAWADSSPAIGKINYYMLGDQNHTISNNFGILREGVGLADRGTFVVDPDGVIQLVEITPEGVGRNAAELVRKIKAAKYWREHPGQVCPAKWEEGAETLAPSIDLVGKI